MNYADDFVGWCRRGAAEVLAPTRQWCQQMGLTLNEEKTRLCKGRREAFTFRGYTVGPMSSRKEGHGYLGAAPAKKAGQAIKRRIRAMLGPGNQAPWGEVGTEPNTVLRGWAAYFPYGPRLMADRAVDRGMSKSGCGTSCGDDTKFPRGERDASPRSASSESGGSSASGVSIWGRRRLLWCDARPRAGGGKPARPVR